MRHPNVRRFRLIAMVSSVAVACLAWVRSGWPDSALLARGQWLTIEPGRGVRLKKGPFLVAPAHDPDPDPRQCLAPEAAVARGGRLRLRGRAVRRGRARSGLRDVPRRVRRPPGLAKG